jgi:predicted nucleic acid-binding protein
MSEGITLDTGALVALERRRDRILKLLRAARERSMPVTMPVAAIAEWWRGRTDLRERILAALLVEPLSEALARTAGEAQAAVRGATVVDAIVMASASTRNDVVLTGDVDDLARLATYFRGVRVLGVRGGGRGAWRPANRRGIGTVGADPSGPLHLLSTFPSGTAVALREGPCRLERWLRCFCRRSPSAHPHALSVVMTLRHPRVRRGGSHAQGIGQRGQSAPGRQMT